MQSVINQLNDILSWNKHKYVNRGKDELSEFHKCVATVLRIKKEVLTINIVYTTTLSSELVALLLASQCRMIKASGWLSFINYHFFDISPKEIPCSVNLNGWNKSPINVSSCQIRLIVVVMRMLLRYLEISRK